jgi:hypothetical protein
MGPFTGGVKNTMFFCDFPYHGRNGNTEEAILGENLAEAGRKLLPVRSSMRMFAQVQAMGEVFSWPLPSFLLVLPLLYCHFIFPMAQKIAEKHGVFMEITFCECGPRSVNYSWKKLYSFSPL